jgi:hypothetical protein
MLKLPGEGWRRTRGPGAYRKPTKASHETVPRREGLSVGAVGHGVFGGRRYREAAEMKTTALRILVGSAVVMIFLGLAVLEIVSERVRVDQLSSPVLNPDAQPQDRWDFLVTQGDLRNLELGPTVR